VSRSDDVKAEIKAQAYALGFATVGFAAAAQADHIGADFEAFIAQGLHGEMDWLARHPERRTSPQGLWPEARSVIAVGLNYGPAADPLTRLEATDRAVVSVYAQGNDYHSVLKKRLKQLARFMAERFETEVKVFVDTAPVMEKPAAARAGLGWQGKHTNLVSREFGSWLFLGEVFTALELEPDVPEDDHCGSCQACLDICPTKAFTAPHRLDATRCISYLTIEHKGHIDREFRVPMGNRVYGCDDCLAICPWNKFAAPTGETAFLPRAELTAPRLADLATLDDAAFRALFAGSPIKRTGRDHFVRNVLIALGNSADADLAAVAEDQLTDPSPLVRAMAVWALWRLLDDEQFAALREVHLDGEPDSDVRREWQTEI
jgi:epoxyqueuosine reductase